MSKSPAIGSDGAANGFSAFDAKMVALSRAAANLAEQTEVVAQRMRDNSKAAVQLSELCDAAQAGPQHAAAAADIAAAFGRTVGGATRLVNSAHNVNAAADGVRTAHRSEYGGMHAVAQAMGSRGVRQAKPGFYLTD
ncbi:hypothetical protein ACIRP3_41605 [Streptomyces sp. NPDC101209]|uniref:hypothetical protein n=1 Tax=Streptomyces sp. NPDC101209 TaxID=3366129 RepID=UPI0038011036